MLGKASGLDLKWSSRKSNALRILYWYTLISHNILLFRLQNEPIFHTGKLFVSKMATKSQKKAPKAAIQSLASPALRQTIMADANASATAAATRPSTPPAEQPTESAVLELIKAEMGISRHQLGDIIKKEMASLHAEIKEDIAALRQDTKADIASLKTEFRVEMSSLRAQPA